VSIETAALNIGRLDVLGYGDSPIHRLDPRVKLLVAAANIVAVVSFPRYEIAGLLPYFALPLFAMILGGIPPGLLLSRILVASPFALGVGVLNPVFDRTPVPVFGVWELAGGWVSFASLLLRFLLTVGTGVILVATTSMPRVAGAMARLGFPRGFIMQLLVLYRYLFVLVEEALRLVRARNLRSFGGRGRGLSTYRHLLAALFVRTTARAGRIHRAMLARGFDGELRTLAARRLRATDMAALLAGTGFAALFRLFPAAKLLGGWLTGGGP